jgi:flagellar biogenesis protein FliO
MKIDPKWLLPPAAALLLLLGPLSMQAAPKSGAADHTPTTDKAADKVADKPAEKAGDEPAVRPGGRASAPALPRTPDLWQLTTTLVGVLLLGGVGIFMLRRMRDGKARRPAGSGSVASLRQVLRLGKHAVYAIEFDDRLLLVGDTDRGLTLLHQGRTAEKSDEAIVAARAEIDDDGAVPRNLAIPRPATPPRTLPRPPLPTPRQPAYGDFRTLLAKAGKA